MSTATAIAQVEAELAEAELGDDELERAKELIGEGSTVAEAIETVKAARELEDADTPAPPADGEELGEPTEKQLKALDRQMVANETRVRAIMDGHVEGFGPCGECGGVGLVPPGPKAQTHAFFRTCETCAGFGEVLTGSLREGHNSRDCPACKGRGYLEAIGPDGAPLAGTTSLATVPPAELVAAPAPTETATADNGGGELKFGTPSWMGDPSLSK